MVTGAEAADVAADPPPDSRPDPRPDAPLDLPGLQPAPAIGASRRTRAVVGTVLALVVVLSVVVAVLVTRKPGGYNADDQQRFMSACMAKGGEPVRSVCGCIYDQLAAKVPYDRFVAIDQQLGEQRNHSSAGSDLQFPPEVEAIRADCVARTNSN
jgi:hypothetical protein